VRLSDFVLVRETAHKINYRAHDGLMSVTSTNEQRPVILEVVEPMAEGAPWTPEDTRYDLRGAAKRLGISFAGTRRLIDSQELGYFRVGGRIQVSEGQIRTYLAACERPPVPALERARNRRYREQARAAARERSKQ
jgi:excisionase family DNA binding protein